jgi:WD40 repeat protein
MSARAGAPLVTAADNVVRVWSRDRLEATLTGFAGRVESVGDVGDDVYVTTDEPVALVLDAIGDPARRRIFGAGTKPLTDVRFDRELGRIVAASWDQFLYVWDAATGALVHRLEGTGPLWAVRTSPDGALTIGLGGVSPRVWDRTSGARLVQLEGHTDLVLDGEFVDDRIFVTIAGNRTALVWDVTAGRPLARFQDVDAMVVAPDRRTVALAGTGGVRLWSPRAPVPALDAQSPSPNR